MDLTFLLEVASQFYRGGRQTQGSHDGGQFIDGANLTLTGVQVETLAELCTQGGHIEIQN